MFSKGFWIRPYHPKEQFIKEIFFAKHCHLFEFVNIKQMPVAEISKLWHLKTVNRSFLEALQLLAKKNKALSSYSAEQALIEKMIVGEQMIHAIFMDPLLPAAGDEPRW